MVSLILKEEWRFACVLDGGQSRHHTGQIPKQELLVIKLVLEG